MICVVIKGPTFKDAQQQLKKALTCADLVELRLDNFSSLSLTDLKKLRSQFSIPMIFTLRSRSQGGNYLHSEEKRLADIRSLAELKPDYLDLENDMPPQFINEIASIYSEIKIILSYHNFAETPQNLDKIYEEMRKIPAFFYKIAVTSNNCLDAFKLICWAKKSKNKLIAISMGLHGQVSRILGPIWGNPITYAALEKDQASAPGQLTTKELLERYRYRSLTSQTAICGIIGDPVDHSIGHITHNDLMAVSGLEAIYIRIQVSSNELSEFLKLSRQLPFRGLSVTMPLKEHILPFLDNIDRQANEMGAVNTLLLKKGKIYGFNTDGIGALNAIEQECKVKGKRIVIIGAGGSAKSIAYEAQRRGGQITIVNRNPARAHQVANDLACIGKGLDEMKSCTEEGYDILINTTPVANPISTEYILPQTIIMDIKTKQLDSEFLQDARNKDCRIVYGYQMFIEQALGQFNHWFQDKIHIGKSRAILENKTQEALGVTKSVALI